MKRKKYKINFQGFYGVVVPLLLVSCLLIRCSPDLDYYAPLDNRKLQHIMYDNHDLSTFLTASDLTEMKAAFLSDRSYVIFAPSNAAFQRAGISPNVLRSSSGQWLSNTVKAHVLEDYLDLSELPFMSKQRLYTEANTSVYVTRWLYNQDTLLTVNGVRVSAPAIPASNGQLYILESLLQDRSFIDVVDAIQSQHNLSLFSYAVSRSGMEEKLRTMQECTIFVPDNKAMVESGYDSFDAIQSASIDELKAMIEYHVLAGHLFVSDIGLSVVKNATGERVLDIITATGLLHEGRRVGGAEYGSTQFIMENNRSLQATFSDGYMNGDYGYRLEIEDGTRISAAVHPINKDIVSTNGVIHLINKVLKF